MLDRVTFGEVPSKHHTALRSESGELRYEECFTREGFDGPYSIVYHERRPHTARALAPLETFPVARAAEPGGLLRHHFVTDQLPKGDSPLASRAPLLFNRDVTISVLKPTVSDGVYFANGDGDDLFFVLEGGGVLKSAYGELVFGKHDYVCVPRGIIHRFELPQGMKQNWLSIECRGGMGLLKQWRNAVGQLKMDAPYSHRDFRKPTFAGSYDEGIRHVVAKRQDRFFGFEHDASPFDLVGYDGTVYPWVFPIMAFQPRVGLVHLPPTWHGTFGARGALVCSFVPRPTDFHREAIPCPYPHSSVDVDEFIFYCDGQFTSRKGIGPGSISLHPAGIAHGPHPGSYENSIGSKSTSELAVMLDCYEPLEITAAAIGIEDQLYHDSFR